MGQHSQKSHWVSNPDVSQVYIGCNTFLPERVLSKIPCLWPGKTRGRTRPPELSPEMGLRRPENPLMAGQDTPGRNPSTSDRGRRLFPVERRCPCRSNPAYYPLGWPGKFWAGSGLALRYQGGWQFGRWNHYPSRRVPEYLLALLAAVSPPGWEGRVYGGAYNHLLVQFGIIVLVCLIV
jgi:hypothetical protein